jgi:hypothetical protein
MRRTTLTIAVLSVVALLLVSGCGSGATKATGGGGSTAGGGTTKPADGPPFTTITPESANEKRALANAEKALANYIANTEAGNKQNGTNTPIFTNKEGYKPRLIAYGFDILSGKRSDGQYGMFSVQAYDGGKQIKPMTMWERYGSVNRDDGKMNETFYKGSWSNADAGTYLVPLTPESAGEKAAFTAVEAWAKKNIASEGYNKVLLTGYGVLFGDVDKRPSMLMIVNPEGTSYISTILWGEQK